MKRGCGIAIQSDPPEGQHCKELDCHYPIDIVGCYEGCEAKEERLHENGERELIVDIFDVVDKARNNDPANELPGAVEN